MKSKFVLELLRWIASFALASAAAAAVWLVYWVCELAGFDGPGSFLAVLVLWTALTEISFLAGMRGLWGPAAAFWWTVFFLVVQTAWILVVLVLDPLGGRPGWPAWIWGVLWLAALIVLARRFRKAAKARGTEERRSGGVRARVLRAAAAAAVGGVFLMSPVGVFAWAGLYPVLCMFGVDHWFPADAVVELSDVSGPDAGRSGTDAHRLEVAKVVYLCRLHTDVDFSWRIVEDAAASVRLRFRTCHPWVSRRLAKGVKDAYDGQKTDPGAKLAVDFASWPERPWPRFLPDDWELPPSVDLRSPVPGAPPEPVFDGTARLVLAAGTNAVPRLLELVCDDGRWYYPVEAHVLLCSILGVSVPAAPDEWCGVRLVRSPTFEDQTRLECDKAALAAAWRRYRETGELPVSFAARAEGAEPEPHAKSAE